MTSTRQLQGKGNGTAVYLERRLRKGMGDGRVEVRRTDVWLGGPTRRPPKPAHVLGKTLLQELKLEHR